MNLCQLVNLSYAIDYGIDLLTKLYSLYHILFIICYPLCKFIVFASCKHYLVVLLTILAHFYKLFLKEIYQLFYDKINSIVKQYQKVCSLNNLNSVSKLKVSKK